MAYETHVGAGPFKVEVQAFGAPPANNPRPLPEDFPAVTWEGINELLVTAVYATDNRSVVLHDKGLTGTFSVVASAGSFQTKPLDVTILEEPIDHIDLAVVPV